MSASVHGRDVTRREALMFEAGIKLGGVFHQYLGIPLSRGTAPQLARAIERAVGLQPYVRAVTVRLRPERGGPLGPGRFAYRYLTAEMLDVVLTLADGPVTVTARLAYRPDLRYPLMRVVRAGGPTRRARAAHRRAGRRGRSVRRTGTSAG